VEVIMTDRSDSEGMAVDCLEEISKVPIKSMRDRLFKIHKDVTKFNKELAAFHKTLSERTSTDLGQDAQIMEAAVVEMSKAVTQLEAAYKWISFINDYGPISDG
jgi:hypothetical protein